MSKKKNKANLADLAPALDRLRIDGTRKFDIKAFATDDRGDIDKSQGKAIAEACAKRIGELQEVLYADHRWSVLLIFQGMDASGKDSAVEHVFSGINPQGCEVTAFKSPSDAELNHDFLWRSTVRLPPRGHFGIFNRSYYEECLVVRVHREILDKQKLPRKLITRNIWRERFEDIVAFERHMVRNGTLVLKFFLHLSLDEQRDRFLARLEEPAKRWKFAVGDIAERALWDKYQAAYQDMIRNTATQVAPWIVVPADRKWFAHAVVGATIVDALEKLELSFPKPDRAALLAYEKIRVTLDGERAADDAPDQISGVATKADGEQRQAD